MSDLDDDKPETCPALDRPDPRPRTPGSMKGHIHVADDFDDPLPDWLLDLFYSVEDPLPRRDTSDTSTDAHAPGLHRR